MGTMSAVETTSSTAIESQSAIETVSQSALESTKESFAETKSETCAESELLMESSLKNESKTEAADVKEEHLEDDAPEPLGEDKPSDADPDQGEKKEDNMESSNLRDSDAESEPEA